MNLTTRISAVRERGPGGRLAHRLLLSAMTVAMAACSHSPAPDADDARVLASVGPATLTLDDLHRDMPGGLSSDDSLRFVKSYVNSWIDRRLVTDVAVGTVDMAEIDRLVEQYRMSLIMQEYRRRMFETKSAEIPADTLRAYFEANRNEFRLERPLVQGVYLKIPQEAPNIRTIRRLYASDRPQDIDQLEKEVLKSAIHYDYFRDHWVDWEQIENRIPADFGADPMQWPQKGRKLEESAGGFLYLLRITDIMPAGTVMPYENAEPMIRRLLTAPARKAYDAALLRDLRRAALDDGNLKINIEL